ncbi:MAG: MFS transporter [Candidatus Cybelea sp.]
MALFEMHSLKRRPRPHNPMPESRYEVLALFTGAMIGASLCIMSTGALMPFFKSALNLDQGQLGWLLSVQFMGSVAMTSVAGLLTDRFGDKAMVRWTGILMALSLVAASLVANFLWLLACLLVYGIGYAAVTPAGSHAIIYFFKKADRGLAMGIRQCGVPIAGRPSPPLESSRSSRASSLRSSIASRASWKASASRCVRCWPTWSRSRGSLVSSC